VDKHLTKAAQHQTVTVMLALAATAAPTQAAAVVTVEAITVQADPE
jgi:hypothetical protein